MSPCQPCTSRFICSVAESVGKWAKFDWKGCNPPKKNETGTPLAGVQVSSRLYIFFALLVLMKDVPRIPTSRPDISTRVCHSCVSPPIDSSSPVEEREPYVLLFDRSRSQSLNWMYHVNAPRDPMQRLYSSRPPSCQTNRPRRDHDTGCCGCH